MGDNHHRAKKSAKVYVENVDSHLAVSKVTSPLPYADEDNSPNATTPLSDSNSESVSGATLTLERKVLTARAASTLSHDISTEQLFSDQLIDAKVADGEDDDEDEDEDDEEHHITNAKHHNYKQRLHSKKHSLPSTSPSLYRIESHSALSSLEAKHLLDKEIAPEDATTPAQSHSVKPRKLAPLAGSPRHHLNQQVTTPTSSSSGAGEVSDMNSPSDNNKEQICAKCIAGSREMPLMHTTAYAGHVQCLSYALLAEQAQNPSSNLPQYAELDKKHRTPLFYSCAANHSDCCTLLLAQRPQWRDLPDKQLDTPVHVCCFFGWHQCLQQLLDAGANPHVRNAKGFKPSHITKTKECLELLLSYGDDLLQGDKLGRTPLFVACARDRSECTEFLCAWNYQTRSWMLDQEDQRGDRPIHAAACNGSLASLETLLKYGADPRIANGKNMTPKDLARANNHDKCVEVLERAEQELDNANTWFAPANAVGGSDYTGSDGDNNSYYYNSESSDGWIECWDSASGQAFYYHNLTGKCQWIVPAGFQPQLQQQQTTAQMNNNNNGEGGGEEEEDDGSEYVWVKKKRQTVCVVTGKATEWTTVQDPVSKAIYYKNTRTGQSQWEEPDAVQQLQQSAGARTAQQASKIWDELETSRNSLAAALAREKHRQLTNQKQAIENYKRHLRQRREEMQKREETAKLQQLLPRSSFVSRKKQSMMMKIAAHNSRNRRGSGTAGTLIATREDQLDESNDDDQGASDADAKLDEICASEPALDIFLTTYLKMHGVRNLQVLTAEKRVYNCLYHYYTALVDPLTTLGLSKSLFRTILRDATIIPTASSASNSSSSHISSGPPPLKLHIVDLIFAQAARADAMDASSYAVLAPSSPFSSSSPHSSSQKALVHHRQAAITGSESTHLSISGFLTAMQLVRERVVTEFETHSADQQEIDDDEAWFLVTYIVPLTLKYGTKLLTQIRIAKELDLQLVGSQKIQDLLMQSRHMIQTLHRHYSSQEAKLKMLTFRGLSQFAVDFGIVTVSTLPALYQLYEAVNWISGNAHTEIISFEKFQQLLTMLAVLPLSTMAIFGSSSKAIADGEAYRDPGEGDTRDEATIMEMLITFFRRLESHPAIQRVQTNQVAVHLPPISGAGVSGD